MQTAPIIFIIFKRPKETTLVWEQIKKTRPSKIFIVADGPRNSEEKKLTDSARAVVETVDWPCEVLRNYSEVNLGCRKRVWSGLDWAFAQLPNENDGAIILEDDCLPDQSFFSFCAEMLQKYANNPQVLHIGGTCFQQDNPSFSTSYPQAIHSDNSYYFSHIAQIWGWATWKRAWKLYDGPMASWPVLKGTNELQKAFPDLLTYNYWSNHFQKVFEGGTDTWDIAWTYTVFKERGLAIMPKVNLVENIGAGDGATHKASRFSNLPTSPLIFPLTHPREIIVNKNADLFTFKKVFGINYSFKNRISAVVKEKLPFVFKHIKLFVK